VGRANCRIEIDDFGLTAMALWAWTLEPRLAAALAVVGGLTGQLLAAFTVRRGWDLRALMPFLAGGLAGLPFGLWLLPRLDVPLFKAMLGAMLVVICPLMFFAGRLPKLRGGRTGDALAGAAGAADASAWMSVVVPSTRLVPLNDAFCTIVVI
jgi:hypothetical protein